MKIKLRIVFAAAIAALMLGALTLAGCSKPRRDDAVAEFWSPPLDSIVGFHSTMNKNAKETHRTVYLAADHKTKVSAEVFYDDHSKAVILYRTSGPDTGTIESAVVSYPAAAGQKEGAVARELSLDVDGRTFVKDRVYTESGVVQYSGDRIATDKYETLEYRIDGDSAGKKVRKHQVFLHAGARWKLDSEELFRDDSSIEKSVQRRDDDAVITKMFSIDNKLLTRAILSSYGTGLVTEYYETDGAVLKKKVEQSTYDVTVTAYAQGKPVESRRFWMDSNRMTVEIYGADERLRLRQSWQAKQEDDLKTNGKIDPAKYQLTMLEYYDSSGFNYKDVAWSQDGTYPNRVTVRDPKYQSMYSGYVYKYLRPDGTVSEIRTVDILGSTTTEQHTAAENLREPVDPADSAPRPFDDPPRRLERVR